MSSSVNQVSLLPVIWQGHFRGFVFTASCLAISSPIFALATFFLAMNILLQLKQPNDGRMDFLSAKNLLHKHFSKETRKCRQRATF